MKPFDIYTKYTEINFKKILFANKQKSLQVTEKKEAFFNCMENYFGRN